MTEYFRPDYTPEWFDLKRYEPLKNMNRKDIYRLISNRSFHYDVIESSSAENTEVFLVQCLSDLRAVEEIKKDFKKREGRGEYIKVAERVALDFFEPSYSIEPIGYGFIEDILESLETSQDEKTKLFNEYMQGMGMFPSGHKVTSKDRYFILGRQAAKGEPLIINEEVSFDDWSLSNTVTINLGNNDDKIIDDMREWLRQKRKNQKAKRLGDAKITGAKGLIEKRVIPCMDLLIWAKFHGFEYSTAQLNEIIFPDVTQDDSTFRRNTQKKAIEYLTTNAYQNIL